MISKRTIATIISILIFSVEATEKTTIEQGSDIPLKCFLKKVQGASQHFIIWEFLPCGRGFNKLKCADARNLPEHQAQWSSKCSGSCKNVLVLTNTTEAESGMYRCLQRSALSSTSTIIRTFEIEIIDSKKYEGHAPAFLETDLNSTIYTYEGLHLVLRCSVYSELPLEISWLREIGSISNLIKNSQYIPYYNKTFMKIDSGGKVEISESIYLSKLIISNTSETDSGLYTCLAMNNRGMQFQEVYVNVSASPNLPEKWEDVESSSFSILFVVPLMLALFPATVWLCYSNRKRCRHCGKIHKSEPEEYVPVQPLQRPHFEMDGAADDSVYIEQVFV